MGDETFLRKHLLEPKPRTEKVKKFIGLGYQGKKDIVLRFIIEYSSLRDFDRPLGNNNNKNNKNNTSLFFIIYKYEDF
jgi:hypothetical protein